MTDTARQKELFEAIHDQYYESTTDAFAIAYKEEFVYQRVLAMMGSSTSVIELASGTGAAIGYLRRQRPDLAIAGCDISPRAAAEFTKIHDAPCFASDLTKSFDIGRTFDTAIVMGGVHHLVADLDMAFANIASLLNPGGRLIMAEPNADYFLEPLRKLWYRLDTSNFDAANEHALSHDRLLKEHGGDFQLIDKVYFGGPAYYLLTLNWILRIPNTTKRWTAPALMKLERMFHHLPGPWPFSSFVACWEKR